MMSRTVNTLSRPAQPAFPFLSLPAELRNKVYHNLLYKTQPIRTELVHQHGTLHGEDSELVQEFQRIILISKQFNHEAKYVFLKNTFRILVTPFSRKALLIGADPSKKLLIPPPPLIRRMRKIGFGFEMGSYSHMDKSIYHTSNSFDNVQQFIRLRDRWTGQVNSSNMQRFVDKVTGGDYELKELSIELLENYWVTGVFNDSQGPSHFIVFEELSPLMKLRGMNKVEIKNFRKWKVTNGEGISRKDRNTVVKAMKTAKGENPRQAAKDRKGKGKK